MFSHDLHREDPPWYRGSDSECMITCVATSGPWIERCLSLCSQRHSVTARLQLTIRVVTPETVFHQSQLDNMQGAMVDEK
ncbi:hypothetical protein NQZ68_030728 [Dissostichus eleginoides]|nr:hypothetical protein NQZ68_030728 [Dissostichus eleginoides]